MPIKFSVEDLKQDGKVDAGKLERVLRQFQTAIETPVVQQPQKFSATSVDTSALARELAALVQPELQATGSSPINTINLLPTTSSAGVTKEGLHADRTSPAALGMALGTTYWETDRTVTYIVIDSGGGSLSFRFKSGVMVGNFVDRPTDLGLPDISFLFYAADRSTIYIWLGNNWFTITLRMQFGPPFHEAIFTATLTADHTYNLPDADCTFIYATSALTANELVVGVGGFGLASLGSAGTSVQVLHGPVIPGLTQPFFGPVVLTTDVSGILPIANGGTGAGTALAALGNLGGAASTGIAANTAVLAKITSGGTDGSLSWTTDGCIVGFVAPT